MRLTADERAVRDEALTEAHRDGGTTRDIGERYVASLRDLERFGQVGAWARHKLDRFMVAGAMAECREWRRRRTVTVTTAKGAEVTMPSYIGAKRIWSASLDEAKAHAAQIEAMRDQLSREVAVWRAAVARWESDPAITSVVEAIEAAAA